MKNTIHMLQSVKNSQMNSFLITTESGKVIAIDGGWKQDAGKFLRYLRDLTGEAVPHVDAWFLTHPHLDHIDAFKEMMEFHRDEVSVDRVYFHFPSSTFLAADESSVQTMEEFYHVLPLFADRVRFVSGGDKLDVGEAHFDILYTHDFEFKGNVCNNSCLVFRMTLGGKSVLFLGDCGVEAGQKILRLWGESGILKSDLCQMAHHGQNGCDKEFYQAVAPTACIWCTPDWLWDNNVGKGFNTHIFKTVEVRGWMDELGVKTHYVMKDGDQMIEL